MRLLPWESKTKLKKAMAIKPEPAPSGYRFTLKGSPRHYDDVKDIIQSKNTAKVYFGEALAYERGAAIALWRVRATDLDWLPDLYAWWVEMERIEPVQFTFHLYLPNELKYPAMDIRDHSAADVAEFIRQNAPYEGRKRSAARQG
jgi:hypothetical protein